MIGAGEKLGIATVGAAHPVTAVAAEVQESAEPPVQIAAQDHRLFPHIDSHEITGIGNFALGPR
jgi:hypothetical protein